MPCEQYKNKHILQTSKKKKKNAGQLQPKPENLD